MFGEVVIGRGLEPVCASAQKNLVAVERHDLLFRVNALYLQRIEGLFELARGSPLSPLAGQEEAARELLRQRRGATRAPLMQDAFQRRADRPHRVDAEVFVKTR